MYVWHSRCSICIETGGALDLLETRAVRRRHRRGHWVHHYFPWELVPGFSTAYIGVIVL